ncbi:MAG: hypothetical protein N2489_00825 [Clostridia bacterium]|nr:hypothetical protein [Clostridia bacterium]
MDFNFDLNLINSRKILPTPQLKQALEILKMTSQELFEYVEEELEKNPFLEVLDRMNTDTEGEELKNFEKIELDENVDNGNRLKYIIPDIIVQESMGKFKVLVNDDSIPLIGINEKYKGINTFNLGGEAKKLMQGKLDRAVWLIECMHQRRKTLKKVARAIVSRQMGFFKNGKSYIEPITMKEIAQDTGMHESTVCRTVSGKHLQCSWGIIEMRGFFKYME